MRITSNLGILLLALALTATACGDGSSAATTDDDGVPSGSITIYSGRKEELVGDLIQRFETETGIDTAVRYAGSPELAATIREEGDNTRADVFFAVDPASLGAVAESGLLMELPAELLATIPAQFSDRDGRWIGTSGRARSVVYDTTRLSAAELPADVSGFTDPAWRGRLAIAPANGSFLAFVSAMILLDGEAATRAWLEGIAANDPATYPKNSVIVAAVDEGEAEAGLVNHYYLLLRQADLGETNAANHFLASGGAGSLVMPAGAGVLRTTDNPAAALAFIEFLLSETSQRFFVDETFEYPLLPGMTPNPALPDLAELQPPLLDLSDLATVLDLATDMVADAGLL